MVLFFLIQYAFTFVLTSSATKEIQHIKEQSNKT